MKRLLLAICAALALGSCSPNDGKTHIYLQRFFGECGAEYGGATDVAKAEGECGIMTALINRFNAENPDVHIDVNVIAWPGYPQLTAQIAARDPPDLVTMHSGVISDYASDGLLEPVEPFLKEAHISPSDFTDATRLAVTIDNRIYALPWDTHGGLFHINTALFAKAGLMRGGKPVLPNSAEELLKQARQFQERTGKPYLIQSNVADPAYAARNQFTYMMAEGAVLFPDAKHVRLATPIGHSVATFFKRINDERLGTQNMDTPAAIAAFINGEGGIYPTGTWMLGTFEKEATTPGRPLFNSYAVFPYPRLWGQRVEFVSGHTWIVPKRNRTQQQRTAIARFFRFMADHNYDWTRTGHLPAFKAVLDDPRFRSLPHREDISPLAQMGRPLPGYVRRQNAIEGIVGEEMAAAYTGQKPIDVALRQAENRVNTLLGELD
ncbi:extracellular solute-binding protein [Sphingomonas sp. SM33]|uniref:Extracellular solute-binding protein n=1 Tax=Sphingomonas telluris TaxID=2907998 RepID=A0ABS9VQM3_9SPHN|nr:extracellular solute-binding protein [Sphingomonas telluris]MCH8617261.1 extracellular solute-binding protein [Sphingomonas telluris]